MAKAIVAVEQIENSILNLRGQKVMLDADLARMYEATTGALNQAVTRNADRFPDDFMFQLSVKEYHDLLSQSVISSSHGGRRTPPYAFTEQGVAMLSSVLRSDRAVSVNIEIMRAFVRLRSMLASHADLARKVESLEQKYDGQFAQIFQAMYDLMGLYDKEKSKKPIGYHAERKA